MSQQTDQQDFSPEVRNSAWWSGDSRRAASGKAGEVILQKLGKMPIPDLSNIERVQMGHVMEPVILGLAKERLQLDTVNKYGGILVHAYEPWLRCHVDGVAIKNGESVLIEAKNYDASQRHKFDPDTGLMPDADRAQLLHELACFGTNVAYLAVLFGGNEFVTIRFEATQQEKEEFVKSMAGFWARVVAGTPLEPTTSEECKVLWPQSYPESRMASQAVEEACLMLKNVKRAIKDLEEREESLSTLVQGYLQDREALVTVDGAVLATWKTAKASKRFNVEMFRAAMPDVYDKFVAEVAGSRRFLVK
jgi:predicted phage-related endonuclease